MEFKLESHSFSLLLKAKVFCSDMYNNTLLEITLNSDGFSACTTMDIDFNEFKNFAVKINDLYETLRGNAAITEPYGEQIIHFSADEKGCINVSGILHSCGKNGHYQSLKFENSFDQTFLRPFAVSLKETFKQIPVYQSDTIN